MIIVFDLDDTLYSEIDYVKSGFTHVSKVISAFVSQPEIEIYDCLMNILKRDGRGHVFDTFLSERGIYSSKLAMRLVMEYRKHNPKISLSPETYEVLEHLRRGHNLYLVTDGNKLVQERKVQVLGIEFFFKRIFITHRFGLHASKPALKCFESIKEIESVDWDQIVYIGDDPNKDFVNLNKVGAKTIRRRFGRFKTLSLDKDYEAQWEIRELDELPLIINDLHIDS